MARTRYEDVLDHYKILKLNREDYPGRTPLPDGYEYANDVDDAVAESLLRPEFPGWRQPVARGMPGFREDSVVAVRAGEDTVAVCYVCDRNQLGLTGYGELHYAAVRPDHRGRGLWRAMITELFDRADRWGVAGVMFVTDRAGPIEMYLRLGADELAIRPKPKRAPLWRRAVGRLSRIAGR